MRWHVYSQCEAPQARTVGGLPFVACMEAATAGTGCHGACDTIVSTLSAAERKMVPAVWSSLAGA